MSQTTQDAGFLDVRERLTRVEAEGEAAAVTLKRLEGVICRIDKRLAAVQDDVQDAKTALRVGLWLSATLIPPLAAVAGWFASTFWSGGK